MKLTYENVKFELIMLANADIITTSESFDGEEDVLSIGANSQV